MAPAQLRERRSIYEIQTEFDNGVNTETLEQLITAWAGIKALPPEDPNSFFVIGGLHGEPFRGAGFGNSAWWGGWCNHGNVLFPTWHRAYLVRLEHALQSVPGCENVMQPYWDETDAYSLANGIPSCLTDEIFTYSDGTVIPNPLRSFTFPLPITDNIVSDGNLYSKPLAYQTVRFPYSGLVGDPTMAAQTAAHNADPLWDTPAKGNFYLNRNVKAWLNLRVLPILPDGTNPPTPIQVSLPPLQKGVHGLYQDCLNAANYTVFSNTTSQGNYNSLLPAGATPVTALEQPHNDIHLAVGGVDITNLPTSNAELGASPDQNSNVDLSPIVGANGDMGENDTAGLDPIFFFHHANVDRMFWVWQKKQQQRDAFEIISEYPGTNSTDNQGPTPGVSGNVWLTMDSPLMPFHKSDGSHYTSKDVVNIEKQLGYTYSIGSLDQEYWPLETHHTLAAAPKATGSKVLQVSGINKGAVSGSFIVVAYVNVKGKKHLVGVNSVLSRHAIQGCANCQTHLNVTAHFDLSHIHESILSDPSTSFSAEIIDHKASRSAQSAALSGDPPRAKRPVKIIVK
jgi:tyrosinase